MVNGAYSEWRVLTPILLVVLSVLGAVVGYLAIDKLNSMSDKSDKLFSIVGEVKTSFEDYRISSEGRFSSIEAQLKDIKENK